MLVKIFYKYEGVLLVGLYKLNFVVLQVFYNKMVGIKKLIIEIGVGQWGLLIVFVGQMFGLLVCVFMVKVSYE